MRKFGIETICEIANIQTALTISLRQHFYTYSFRYYSSESNAKGDIHIRDLRGDLSGFLSQATDGVHGRYSILLVLLVYCFDLTIILVLNN